MSWKFNPFTSQLDYYEQSTFRGVLSSAPSSPSEGWTYINSTNDGYYIYYGGTWQLLHTLTPGTASYILMENSDIFTFENNDRALLE